MNAKTIYKRGVMRLGRRGKKNERASEVFEEVRKKDEEAKVSVKLVVFVVIASLAIFGYSEAWGFDWKYYGTNEEGTYFYETETLTRLSQNIVRVCVQSIYTEKGISHWVKKGGKEFQELDFSLILYDFNCLEKSIYYLRIVFFSKNGEMFYPIKNEEWHFFAPDSMFGILFNEVCK